MQVNSPIAFRSCAVQILYLLSFRLSLSQSFAAAIISFLTASNVPLPKTSASIALSANSCGRGKRAPEKDSEGFWRHRCCDPHQDAAETMQARLG